MVWVSLSKLRDTLSMSNGGTCLNIGRSTNYQPVGVSTSEVNSGNYWRGLARFFHPVSVKSWLNVGASRSVPREQRNWKHLVASSCHNSATGMAIEKFFSRPDLRPIKIQTRESFDLIFVNYGSTAITLTADLRVQELTAADGYEPLSWVDKNAISAKQPLGIIEWPKLVKRDSLQTNIVHKESDEVGWILNVTPRGGKPVRYALQYDKVYFA